MNHRTVARWTGLNESTLSKRARGRDPQEVWAEALRASASKVHIPGADQGAVFAPPVAPTAPTPMVLLTDVLSILEFLALGESVERWLNDQGCRSACASRSTESGAS